MASCQLYAFLILSGLCPGRVEAQARSIRFEHISLDHGLSQSTVNCILQDQTGFIWLGTQDGLNRYDGYGFEVYRNHPSDPSTLPRDWILALLEDPTGDLWIGTQGGGLARWQRDTDSFVRYQHDPRDPESLSGNRVWAITRDRTGALWLGTSESGLNRFDPATGEFRKFRHDDADPMSLSSDEIRAIYEDRRGRLWVATLAGLDLFDPLASGHSGGVLRHYRHVAGDPASLSDQRIRALLEDRSGALWIGTYEGLNRLDHATGKVTRFVSSPAQPKSLSGNRVRAVFEDDVGRLWVGTDDGLSLWQSQSESFVAYHHDASDLTSLSSDRVMAIAQDRGGVLWIGTQGGVSKWNPNQWSFLHYRGEPTDASGASKLVFAFSEDREGKLWVGSLGGGLSRFDRERGETDHLRSDPGNPRSLPDDRVTALLHDRDGTLWVGTLAGGLSRYQPSGGNFERFQHDPQRIGSLSHDAVAALFEDRRGELWIGTYGGGVNRVAASGRGAAAFVHFRHDPSDPSSLSNDRVVSMAENASGLWLATDGGGLNRFDGEAFLAFRHDPADATSLSSDAVTVVHVAAGGQLYSGTPGRGFDKLLRLDESTGRAVFENFSARDGLPNETVWGIESDDDGCLWLSTNNGLSRFDPRNETFKNFNVSHGLQSNEFNMGAYFRSPSGELFFGGVNGFNAFFPDRIQSNTTVPPVVLTSFSKLNQAVSFDHPIFDVRHIPLGYRDTFFSFEFAALDFTSPKDNRYRYRLEGFHDDWIDLNERRRVDFTNLDPGRYRLRLQGSNNDGVWNEDGLVIELSVRPPWWKTWWSKLTALLGGTSIVLVAYRIRIRSIRKNNEQLRLLVDERTRELERAQDQLLRQERLAALGEVAGSVAHEIRNPLGAIRNSIYLLRQSWKPPSPEAADDLALVERQIRQAGRIISELLDFARDRPAESERFSLTAVAERVIAENESPDGIHVETVFEPTRLIVEADACQIEQVLTNLLRNAIEAMPTGGELTVTCRRRGTDAVVSFVDAGIGIAPEEISKIFEPLYTNKPQGIGLGLALSERYARLNHGRIECESELGKGAAFRLALPIRDGSDPR